MKRALALAGLACAAISCAKILGVSTDPERASVHLCQCQSDFVAVFDSVDACASYIDERLSSASDDDVADWLDEYEASCTKCEKPKKCFYSPPVCRTRGCTKDWQCCSALHGGTCHVDTGICSE